MRIERLARRHVVKAIEIEKEICSIEIRERHKGNIVVNSPEYNELRKRFAQKCAQLNSMANIVGKGRDDLNISILLTAEDVGRKVSGNKSQAVRKLAEGIKKAFAGIRAVLRKYSENLEALDPQLWNNPELVRALAEYERTWEKGKDFFCDPAAFKQLIYFSQLIEGVCEKHEDIQEKVNSMDTELFIIIPCLLVLNSLDEDDRGICGKYYPVLMESGANQEEYKSLKRRYQELRRKCRDNYELYNTLEKAIIDETQAIKSSKKYSETTVKDMVHKIKCIAMEIQRCKPEDWNSFIEVGMGIKVPS
eukprot:TRINITY_DN2762_c0_g1_i7.p1 TRINITY_DN2762_c0_g1~~TRINITY_DN2762_c0_g1_i7.p1  ORF type:complete len:306 (+),score=102.53 TRINITY_DN2762_c0_g1_i7:789-1706(+)